MDSVSKQKNKSELDDLISEGFAYQRDLEDKGTFIVSPNFLIHKIAELRQEIRLLKDFVSGLPQKPVTDIELYAKQLIDADRLKHIKIIEMEDDLSVRSIKALSNDGFISLGDVVFRTESEMLKMKNFGRKSLNELKEVLEEYGACLKKTDFRMGCLEQDLLILFWNKIKTDFLLPYKIYNAILGKKLVKNGVEKIITKEKADFFLNEIKGREFSDNPYKNTEEDDNLIKEALFGRGWVEFPCYKKS